MTATDVVLTITEMLRKHGVVGKFVEFYGEGVASVPLANRATIGNMSPEFGSTAAMFPIDDVTLDYLRLTGRSEQQVALVEAYAKVQKLWHDAVAEPVFSEYMELDLATVVPSIAGPKRPQDRIVLSEAKTQFEQRPRSTTPTSTHDLVDLEVEALVPGVRPGRTRPRTRTAHHDARAPPQPRAGQRLQADAGDDCRRARSSPRPRRRHDRRDHLVHQHLEPVGHARRRPRSRATRVKKGLKAKPWVKTTLAPGLEGRHRLLREGRPRPRTSRTSASTRSATAARPASATPVR